MGVEVGAVSRRALAVPADVSVVVECEPGTALVCLASAGGARVVLRDVVANAGVSGVVVFDASGSVPSSSVRDSFVYGPPPVAVLRAAVSVAARAVVAARAAVASVADGGSACRRRRGAAG